MAKSWGISWCVITDEDLDPGTGDVRPEAGRIREQLEDLKSPSDLLRIWPVDLEAVLGTPSGKATPTWQKENLLPLELDQIGEDMPQLKTIGEAVRTWILESGEALSEATAEEGTEG